MPAWAGFIVASQLLAKLTEAYQTIINLSMLIFDRLADLSFSLFICHETAEENVKKWLLDRYRDWILIAIYASNPIMFTVLNYDTIKNSHYFKLFWNSDPVLKTCLEKTEQAINLQNKAKDALDFVINAMKNSFLFKFIDTLVQTFNQPIQFISEFSKHIVEAYEANRLTEQVAISEILNKFKPNQIKEVKILPASEIINTVNPVLAIATPQIFAHILSYYAYSKIIHMKKCVKPSEQMLRFLHAKVTLNEQEIAKIKPDEQLKLTAKIPIEKIKPDRTTTITLNYAGIKRKIFFYPPRKKDFWLYMCEIVAKEPYLYYSKKFEKTGEWEWSGDVGVIGGTGYTGPPSPYELSCFVWFKSTLPEFWVEVTAWVGYYTRIEPFDVYIQVEPIGRRIRFNAPFDNPQPVRFSANVTDYLFLAPTVRVWDEIAGVRITKVKLRKL